MFGGTEIHMMSSPASGNEKLCRVLSRAGVIGVSMGRMLFILMERRDIDHVQICTKLRPESEIIEEERQTVWLPCIFD